VARVRHRQAQEDPLAVYSLPGPDWGDVVEKKARLYRLMSLGYWWGTIAMVIGFLFLIYLVFHSV